MSALTEWIAHMRDKFALALSEAPDEDRTAFWRGYAACLADLEKTPVDEEAELWAELERRGAALRVGYCYPAMCSDDAATELVHTHGYEFGPFQFIELGHRLAEKPQWPMFAKVPPKFRPDDHVCESCGERSSVQLADGSTWCRSCDAAAQNLGYSSGEKTGAPE